MAEFRTPIIFNTGFSVGYHDNILMLGSCFTDNIGARFAQAKMPVTINPYGVLFNPLSIASTIIKAIDYKPVAEEELIRNNDLWVNLDFHGSFSSTDKYEALKKMNIGADIMRQKLPQTSVLILTFGTAYVYRYLPTNQIVANCHKLPGNLFSCERLSVDDIVLTYSNLINNLSAINHKIRIVLTVSPVRHLRDGMHNNQLSKSILLLAAEQLCSKFEQVHYFPSYEIMMDDLRDYRFYDTDMIHPSSLAIDYIWEKFRDKCISKADNQLIDDIMKLQNAVNHKPLNPKSLEFQKFILSQIEKTEKLSQKYPNIDFSDEMKHFKCLIR